MKWRTLNLLTYSCSRFPLVSNIPLTALKSTLIFLLENERIGSIENVNSVSDKGMATGYSVGVDSIVSTHVESIDGYFGYPVPVNVLLIECGCILDSVFS